jgi:hypothetical protein
MQPVKSFLALAALCLATSTGAYGGVAGAGARPTLLVASETPLVVLGRGFEAGERVRLVASVRNRVFRKPTVAGPRGVFRVRFAAVDASCGPAFVSAVGSDGSRASVRRVPEPCGADPDAGR